MTANPHAMGFYRAAGFVDCGITVTDLGTARAWCWRFNDCGSLPIPLSGMCAFPGHGGLHKYAGHASYRAVDAHDGRNADDVISRPNKRAPTRKRITSSYASPKNRHRPST